MSRPHRNGVERVYQQTLKTDLYVVLEGRYIDEVTNVFLTEDQYREMYTANSISPDSTTGEYLNVYNWADSERAEAYIKAAPLIEMALESIAYKKPFPFSAPIDTPMWETGLARYNKYFATFGIKYINAKSHFVKAPTPKVKPCPKQAIYNVKKTIIDMGTRQVKLKFGAAITFGADGYREVDGSAYVIKKLGFDLKTVVIGPEICVYDRKIHRYNNHTFETYGQFMREVGTMQYDLTDVQTKELEKTISDWWKGLGTLKAE